MKRVILTYQHSADGFSVFVSDELEFDDEEFEQLTAKELDEMAWDSAMQMIETNWKVEPVEEAS